MFEVRQTAAFADWSARLRDPVGKAAIARRIRRIEDGHFGDAKALGGGLSELRIDVGPGYRVYFRRTGATVILLLAGGDKGGQDRDIGRARAMMEDVGDDG